MKLAVGGCSFSDYRYDIDPYGAQISRHFDWDYFHAAACAGSNFRTWRVLTRAIMDQQLTSGDVILLQYTILDRKEVYSPDPRRHVSAWEKLDDVWEDGKIFRLTAHSEAYSSNINEKQLSKLHNRFSNHNFNVELFETQACAFQALCSSHNIKTIHINSQYDQDIRTPGVDLTSILDDPLLRMDSGHMNQTGHNTAAAKIIKYLNQAIDSN